MSNVFSSPASLLHLAFAISYNFYFECFNACDGFSGGNQCHGFGFGITGDLLEIQITGLFPPFMFVLYKSLDFCFSDVCQDDDNLSVPTSQHSH